MGAPPSAPRAVLIDVGFTLSAYDGERIARIAAAHGVAVAPETIHRTEARIRRELLTFAWTFAVAGDGADRGRDFYQRVLQVAGAHDPAGGVADEAVLRNASRALWEAHIASNIWDRILPGVPEALERLRAAGFILVVVSNSEGNIEDMLVRRGLRAHFAAVLDSGVVGLAKPDPRYFALALAAAGVPPDQAIMVGDSLVADVQGAHAAGIAAALIDPYDLFPGAPAPRFADFAAFADDLLRRHRQTGNAAD